MSDKPKEPTGNLNPEQRAELQRKLDEATEKLVRGTGSVRHYIYLVLAAAGLGLSFFTAPEGVKNLVTTGKWAGDTGPTARSKADSSREDAKRILREILAAEPALELQTITDEQVRAGIDRILSDKQVSSPEIFDLIIRWQETELLKNARRYDVLEKAPTQAGDPAALQKREQRLAVVGHRFGTQILQDGNGPLAAKWRDQIAALNGKDDTAARRACDGMREDLARFVSFSADLVTTIAQTAKLPITAEGQARLVAYEKQLLERFASERYELLGEAEALRAAVGSVKTLGTMHKRWTAKMASHGVPSKDGEAKQKEIDATAARIDAQCAELGRVMTVIELRNQAVTEPEKWGPAAKKATEEYFKGAVPAEPSAISATLREDRIRATDRLRAELNNDTQEGVEAECILSELAYVVQNRGNDAAVMRRANDFLKRTENSTDDKTKKMRGIVADLIGKNAVTLPDVQKARGELEALQDLAVGRVVIDRITEWAGAHKASISDENAMKDKGTRDRIAESRISCAKAAIETLNELLKLRTTLNRWESGFAAAKVGVNAESRADTVIILDPNVGAIEADQRKQFEKGKKELSAFLGELADEHKLKEIDLRRDAASKTVSLLRGFIHVLDRLRGEPGQNTPHSIALREIVQSLDEKPLKDLLQRSETLYAALQNEQMGTTKNIAADRRATKGKEADIERLRTELRARNLTPESVAELIRTSGPELRIALRYALEDRQREAIEPFLTEEMANLLKLAAYSTEGSGWVGEMAQSRDSWWKTALFVIGLLLAYKSGKGLLGVRKERSTLRKFGRASNLATMEILEKMEWDVRESTADALDETAPDTTGPAIEDLSRELDGPDILSGFDHKNAKKRQNLAEKMKEFAFQLEVSRGLLEKNSVQLTLPDQVRTRTAIRPAVEAMEAKARTALARGADKTRNASREALETIVKALERLKSTLLRMESSLPATVPPLADADLDTADWATILLLAQKEGLDLDASESVLRDALKEKKTPPPTDPA